MVPIGLYVRIRVAMHRYDRDWFSSPLKVHILLRLGVVALVASALLLVVFFNAYQRQLENERSHTSLGFNLFLQAALENAMLKRDVPGLADIVSRLGNQPGMRQVLILNPQGEVRFASQPDLLGQQLPHLVPTTLLAKPHAEFAVAEDGGSVLRSINPVRNKAPCAGCHGAASVQPVNGILVVDYDATELRQQAWVSAALFTAACLGVLLFSLAVLWYILSRKVLEPVAALSLASADLEAGRLDGRVVVKGEDELAQLGNCFNSMASRIEIQMDQLRAQQQYLQNVLDSLPDGIRVIRVSDMSVVMANHAYCQQLGVTPEAVLGSPCYASSHHRDEPCIPTMVVCPLHALKEKGDSLKATHNHVRADGNLFPVEIHAALVSIEQEGRSQDYIVESVRDLSQAARISQSQRLSELGLLAAGIAHEIHNPLASVKLGVQGLSRDIRADRCSLDMVVDYLGLIDSEIDKCVVVTRRLLLLSRTPVENPRIVDVGTALDDAVRLLDYDAKARGIEQELELSPESLRVLADEGELRMVFLNLLQNAHHAMPDGGKLIGKVSRVDSRAMIEIIDTGEGIEPEILSRIFDPFFSNRADQVAGTGLGLTIVKNIIECCRGSIEVESTRNQGTLFRVRLPLADAEGMADL